MEPLNTPDDMSRDLLHFIAKSPSVFHAVRGVKAALAYAGFTELREEDTWQIEKGGNTWSPGTAVRSLLCRA